MSDVPSFLRRFGPGALAALFGVGLIAFVAYFLTTDDAAPKKRVNETVAIKLIQPPPPPPPPPPPKVERPPEPPKIVEQTPVREPEVKQDRPPDKPKEAPKQANEPPPGPLALDAKGEGAGDAFGLGGKPGGNGLFGGGGGGVAGSRFGWYASLLQTQVQQVLHRNEKLAHSRYRLAYKLWLSDSGKPERVELLTSTGDAELDALIKDAVANMPALQPPPKDMPQPVVLGTSALQQG